MRIIQPPNSPYEPSLFLGGSISGAPDWQREVVEALGEINLPLIVLNPRRDDFNVLDPTMEQQQIEWEFRHLRMADALMFWFSGKTLAPITLFELGRHSIIAGRPIFIGIDPTYKRKKDVQIQMKLVNPHISIYYSIDDVLNCIKRWLNKWHIAHGK